MNQRTKLPSGVAAAILATAISLGALAVWLFILIWVMFFYQMLAPGPSSNTELQFTVDGEALLVTSEQTLLPTSLKYRLPSGDTREEMSSLRQSFRTLDGKAVDVPTMLQDQWESRGTIMPGPELRSHEGGMYGSTFSYLSQHPPTFWYLVLHDRDGGRAYFEGFDPQTKYRIGYLGTHGFRDDLPPLDEQFAMPERLWPAGSREPDQGDPYFEPRGTYAGPQYLMSGDKVYHVDFDSRSVTPVELPAAAVALGATAKPTATDEGKKVEYAEQTLIRLPTAIRYLDGREIPLPKPVRAKNLQVKSTLGDGVILVARDQKPSASEIYWIDKEGKVTRHETRPPNPRETLRTGDWETAVGAPAPLLLAALTFVMTPISHVSRGVEHDYASALAATLPRVWAPLAVVCLVSVVLAGLVYSRHRRYSRQGATGWAMFVLLLGIPGAIGYLLHRNWPSRTRCETCGAVVPRDTATCLACTNRFPAPVLKGIEVLA